RLRRAASWREAFAGELARRVAGCRWRDPGGDALNSAKLLRERLFDRQKIAPRQPFLQRAAQQKGGMVGRQRADLAAAGVEFEPAAARSCDPFLGLEQSLRRRLAEADQNIGVGELDLAADKRQADGALVRRRRAVAGRAPGH